MRVSVNVNQEGRGHEMRRLLRLLVQHKTVGVADQRPIVCVKEHLIRELSTKRRKYKLGEKVLARESPLVGRSAATVM